MKNTKFITLAVLMLTLTACSSTQNGERVRDSESAIVEETVVEEATAEEMEVVAQSKPTPEAVTEPTDVETVVEELVEELYIPEGIDMASTLPGEEWVASFVGNVAEPFVVIYNDNSGRKEVVQANSEVTINPDEDIIVVYMNEEEMRKKLHNIIAKETIDKGCYDVISLDNEMRDIRERNAKVTVRGGAEDWVLEFTIISE